MIKIKEGVKSYYKNNTEIKIFNNLNITFKPGNFYMIIGKSGSGKSTLINILGLLDNLDYGLLSIDGKNIKMNSDTELSKTRMGKVGIVFQDYYLNPRLTAYENVYIATVINNEIKPKERKKVIESYFDMIGISNRLNHYPKELSGGEQQRVCIARALVNNPTYILADEPTGSLDPENVDVIIDLLKKLRDKGKCIIMVTHDMTLINNADYVYRINNYGLEEYK